ncbi:hypothetical protein [Actinoplanes sp. NPDC048796]|uniref:effector-associated constant component EACC1 n=1 Tax=Actinoplanes sp. NPDC048796 TaxID=3155640 RepID=UPI0033D95C43
MSTVREQAATITVTVADDEGGEEILDLHQWLRQDPDLRTAVTPAYREPEPGEMSGEIVEALTVAVTSQEFVVALVTGISTWAATRMSMRRSKIRVKRGTSEIEIDAADIPEPDLAAQRLYLEMDETDPRASS